MKFENLKEIMLMNSVDGERTPSGTYPKVQVDEAIQELVDILAGKDATIRKILSESLSKQNESVVFENKMADRIKELMEECRKYKLAEESANAKSKDLAMRVVELQDKVKSLEVENKAWCSQWTSIKDGLPKHNGNYAVVLEGVECIVPFDDCGQEFGWWERTYTRSGGVDGEEFTKADVTHWIELPPVPTKEKSDG